MNKIKLLLCFLLFIASSFLAKAEDVLLPKPQHVEWTKGKFAHKNINLNSNILCDEWNIFLEEMCITENSDAKASINVTLTENIPEAKGKQEEAYRLTVTRNRIDVEATTIKGIFWAIQTLRQLAGGKTNSVVAFPACKIVDWPAFPIRGFMQDVGRSYISLQELKREIAVLSKFKVNVFHWHLTENQAWRLESKIFPMLNDSVNMTRMPGKYYTQQEARELADFCSAHNILLIPEIDMPGHSAAFERTFRHDMQSKEGMKILKLLLDEVCEVFPDLPYLHIGTDEVRFTNPTFVSEMVSYIRNKGKKVISWNPGWNYKPGEIDMTQLWSFRGKTQPGIPAIDSKFHYANHFDTFADIVALYNSTIYNKTEGDTAVVGSILAFWHDRLMHNEYNQILENGLYPHMLALAERTWTGGGREYFNADGTNLTARKTTKFQQFADFERRMLWHKKNTFKGYPFGYVKQTHVNWNITDAFPNEGDLAKKFPPEDKLDSTYTYQGKTYGVKPAIGAGIYLRHVWGSLGSHSVPTFYKDAKENHTAYAFTWVFSPCQQEVGLMAETQNYSRSEADLPPKPGTWDYRGSTLWINDQIVTPPTWTATHTTKSNEIPLGNENCVARPPIKITLEKGWNKVLWKLPVGKFQTPEVRLVKWMFTTVFVTLDGSEVIDELIYSPEKKKKF